MSVLTSVCCTQKCVNLLFAHKSVCNTKWRFAHKSVCKLPFAHTSVCILCKSITELNDFDEFTQNAHRSVCKWQLAHRFVCKSSFCVAHRFVCKKQIHTFLCAAHRIKDGHLPVYMKLWLLAMDKMCFLSASDKYSRKLIISANSRIFFNFTSKGLSHEYLLFWLSDFW